MNTLLSIIIPTFNRFEKLVALLEGLRGRLPACVSLTVLDNHSTDLRYVNELPVFLKACFGGRPTTLVRRNANYAMEGNMMRCYEIADAPWMWMIGDDETVSANMDIDAILALLAGFDLKRVAGCVFSSNLGAASRQRDGLLFGVEESLAKARLSSLLLLSTTIYNVALTRSHMREAMHACHTACPHVAAVLMALNAGAGLAVSSLEPLRWNVSTDKEGIHGAVYDKDGGLALKVSRLMELPLDRAKKALLYQALARCYCSVDVILRGVYQSEPSSIMGRVRLLAPYSLDVLRFDRRFASRIGAVLALFSCLHQRLVPGFLFLRGRVKKISPRSRRHPDIQY